MRSAPVQYWRAQRWLEQRWYGAVAPNFMLRLAASLFGLLVGLRRRLYLRGWLKREVVAVPVIVVGNIGIGGAGKTPLTAALVHELGKRGWRPGVVSRGYGGVERGPALLPEEARADHYGDESVLLRRQTGRPVAVARRRAQGAQLLVGQGCNVVIADDGLQHYALARNIEIAVVDARRRFGNSQLLPAGPLREPLSRLDACDFRVLHGDVPAEPGWTPMRLELGELVNLSRCERRSLAALQGQAIHAVAGIADPSRFFAALNAAGFDVEKHSFADHHPFRAEDFVFDDGRPLLMTMKDAVKCRDFAKPNWYGVEAAALLPDVFFDAVEWKLREILSQQPA